MLALGGDYAPDEIVAALSGSPEGVPAGDDASLFVSFTEPCLGSAPIMALVRNPVWRGPLGVAARAGRDAAGSRPAAGHYTAKHARNGSNKETGVLEVPGDFAEYFLCYMVFVCPGERRMENRNAQG